MPMTDKERDELGKEIDTNMALGVQHLYGAEADLISKNSDLILHCVHQQMLQDECTFEKASVAFVLRALKYQQSREMFNVGSQVSAEGDPYKQEAA